MGGLATCHKCGGLVFTNSDTLYLPVGAKGAMVAFCTSCERGAFDLFRSMQGMNRANLRAADRRLGRGGSGSKP